MFAVPHIQLVYHSIYSHEMIKSGRGWLMDSCLQSLQLLMILPIIGAVIWSSVVLSKREVCKKPHDAIAFVLHGTRFSFMSFCLPCHFCFTSLVKNYLTTGALFTFFQADFLKMRRLI